MIHAVRKHYFPNKVVLFRSGQKEIPDITRLVEFAKDFSSIEEKATAYICKDYKCDLPTTDRQEMLALLEGCTK